MLGDLLAAAREGAADFQPWLERTRPDLAAAVKSAAGAERTTPTAFVRCAVADFARFASEEDWAALSSTLKRTADPGSACLLAMVDWRLSANACISHSHRHHVPEGTADDRSDP